MNQLSWLLYIGNVLGNVGPLLFIFGLIVAITTAGLYCAYSFYRNSAVEAIKDVFRYSRNTTDAATIETLVNRIRSHIWIPYVGGAVTLALWLAAALCPSSETVYAIAASQMGEKALQQPIVGKAGEALNAWLDKQIKENK